MAHGFDFLLLQDIEALLSEASKKTNHRQFVIVGSFSVFGTFISPPLEMRARAPVELYAKNGSGIELSKMKTLSQFSDFQRRYGFHAKPVAPEFIAAPANWESRLSPITLGGGVLAWFMDVHDAGCEKLVHGHDDDLNWVKAGLLHGVLGPLLMLKRLATCVNVLDGEIQQAKERLKSML